MARILFKVLQVLSLMYLRQIHLSFAQTQCIVEDGKCTYNVNLSPAGSCSQPTDSYILYDSKPQEIRQIPEDKMNQMQQDFNTVKDDHENRIRELENSIQKVLRNALPPAPPGNYHPRQMYTETNYDDNYKGGHEGQEGDKKERPGNLLLFQLQSQFNRLTTSLSERTADLLDARNKLNETTDLLTAAQKQAMDSSSKLVSLETKASVLERETNILKNKLKGKTERLEYTNEQLNISQTKLSKVETQLYDVVRAESTVREELETLKINFKKTYDELESLKVNHTDLTTKYKKTRRTLNRREEELMECYKAKTQSFCGFEDPDVCGFTQDNGTDDFDWERHQGGTPSAATGPEDDHTCKSKNGYYMYIEASGKTNGNKARLISPKYRGLTAHCVEFYYHMSGRHIGTLDVRSRQLTSDEYRSVWRVFGNQGHLWIKASVSISEETVTSGYQLIFEATVEQGFEGDISIDDFRITDGICEADASSSEITPAPISERDRSQLFRQQIERYRKMLRKRQRERNRASA